MIKLFLSFVFIAVLSSYPIDKATLTVSGLSSGAYMAGQYHVAFSSEVIGAGIYAGGPYYCAQGQLATAFTNCMYGIMIDVNKLVTLTKGFSQKQTIDNVANLTNTRAYLYSGNKDSVVYPVVMKALDTYYKAFTSTANIKTNFNTASEHCLPTDSYGNACAFRGTPYINNCKMDGAGEMFEWVYGTLKPKVSSIAGNIITIDQSKFIPHGYTTSSLSVSPKGFAYIPTGCQGTKENEDEKCKIHVSFHGCLQTTSDVGDKYYAHGGFNEWAEANNIVVVYPQAVKSNFMPTNPNGCWDWWGYVNQNYAVKDGPQLQMVRNMMLSLIDK